MAICWCKFTRLDWANGLEGIARLGAGQSAARTNWPKRSEPLIPSRSRQPPRLLDPVRLSSGLDACWLDVGVVMWHGRHIRAICSPLPDRCRTIPGESA